MYDDLLRFKKNNNMNSVNNVIKEKENREYDIEANDHHLAKSVAIDVNIPLSAPTGKNKKDNINVNIVTSLCEYAITKYGGRFTTLVSNLIPYFKNEEVECEHTEEYLRSILTNIDIELGYTKKELELMNDPILEFSYKSREQSKCGNLNHRIKSILDIFYKEIQEDCYAYA